MVMVMVVMLVVMKKMMVMKMMMMVMMIRAPVYLFSLPNPSKIIVKRFFCLSFLNT